MQSKTKMPSPKLTEETLSEKPALEWQHVFYGEGAGEFERKGLKNGRPCSD